MHLLSVGGLEGGSLGWRGPGSGPAGALGEGLAGWPGKGLAGAAEVAPARVLAGETCFAHLIFVALVLVVALLRLGLRSYLGLPPLLCLVWSRARL